jgi:hypothetical protein
MCYLRPLTIKAIKDRKVLLEKGIEALYNKKVGRLKKGDRVLVFGNLIINKIYEKSDSS